MKVGGGGWMFLNGQIKRIPPRGPVTRILEQLLLYDSIELERASLATRDTVKREALDAIADEVAVLRDEAEPFHSPRALVTPQTKGKG